MNSLQNFGSSIATRRIAQVACAIVLATVAVVLGPMARGTAETAVAVPAPLIDEPKAAGAVSETAILSGGCFWGVQAVFQHVKGVDQVVSGYSGGTKENASYPKVSTGATGHAESVKITFDPRIVSYGTILQVYFSVAHNPTELNRQGPDAGTQYRSAIFVTNDSQKQIAETYIAQLDKAHVFASPIVTRVAPLDAFYPAEGYHQDYATLHPDNSYIAYNDLPKVENLSQLFPALYRPKAKLVTSSNMLN
jgi:peptide-methionine (S)-S-oxide reductase